MNPMALLMKLLARLSLCRKLKGIMGTAVKRLLSAFKVSRCLMLLTGFKSLMKFIDRSVGIF